MNYHPWFAIHDYENLETFLTIFINIRFTGLIKECTQRCERMLPVTYSNTIKDDWPHWYPEVYSPRLCFDSLQSLKWNYDLLEFYVCCDKRGVVNKSRGQNQPQPPLNENAKRKNKRTLLALMGSFIHDQLSVGKITVVRIIRNVPFNSLEPGRCG